MMEFSWHVDEVTWLLGGGWLLLATAVFLTTITSSDATNPQILTAVILLTMVGFLPLIAGSLITLLAMWLLLVMACGITWALAGGQPGRGWTRLGWLLPGLSFVWLAAVNTPDSSIEMNNLSSMSATAVLIASLLQLSATWHRPEPHEKPWLVLWQAAPVIAGGILLARLVANMPMGEYRLLITAVGLIGLLVGVYGAWRSPASVITGLAIAQTGVVVLAAGWAGPAAALAEIRVLVLATGILYLTADFTPERSHWWRAIAPAVALAALAGLPLTAGFAGRAALYTAWVEDGRWLLILVVGLLHIPLITAAFLHVWQKETNQAPSHRLIEMAVFIPALGLFSFSFAGHFLVWPMVLLPALTGMTIPWRWPHTASLRELFALALPLNSWQGGWQMMKQLSRGWRTAVREAVMILEGEGGLLWLLVLVIVFWLVR